MKNLLKFLFTMSFLNFVLGCESEIENTPLQIKSGEWIEVEPNDPNFSTFVYYNHHFIIDRNYFDLILIEVEDYKPFPECVYPQTLYIRGEYEMNDSIIFFRGNVMEKDFNTFSFDPCRQTSFYTINHKYKQINDTLIFNPNFWNPYGRTKLVYKK